MTFVKAEPAVSNMHKSRPIASIRLFDNGNCTIILPRAFLEAYLPGSPPGGMFSVQWGAGQNEGKAMIARTATGTIKARDIKGCVMLDCLKPPHAPIGKRAAKDCRLLSFKDGGVLVQLPNWKA